MPSRMRAQRTGAGLATIAAAVVGTGAYAQDGPRTVEIVYDNLSHTQDNGTGGTFLGTCEDILEDCRFAPGPWAGAHSRLLTSITYQAAMTAEACTPMHDVLIVFWRLSDLDFAGWSGAASPMINPAAAPLAVARTDISPYCQTPPIPFTTDLTTLPGGGVPVPDGDTGVAVQLAWITRSCNPASIHDLGPCMASGCGSASTLGLAFGSNSLERATSISNPGTANPATVGSTLPDYGRDISNAAMCPNIGWFLGNGGPPVNSGNIEHRFIIATPTAGPNTGIPTTLGMQLLLSGQSLHCGSADFDHDGSPGTDADIAAFFACLAGNCCAACGPADFNGDGDVGTDADIEAFFFVLGGGSC